METVFIATEVADVAQLMGAFYVIEDFPHPQFVLDHDGELKSFDNYADAKQEADDCQRGIVICL